MKFILNKQFIYFTIIGCLNTGLTYFSYILLLNFFSYSFSYFISYILGIVFSFILNSKVVFKTQITLWKFIKYPIVYITQFILNWLFLYILVDKLDINKQLAPLIVTVVSIPVTFLLSKIILTNSSKDNKGEFQ